MRTVFDFAYRLEREHAAGVEVIVQHDTFTPIFGAYLACAAHDPGSLYRVMHRARIMRSSDDDAAIEAFRKMPKGSDKTRTATDVQPLQGGGEQAGPE
jgi:hypothetical protein